jgi:CcmD family protein
MTLLRTCLLLVIALAARAAAASPADYQPYVPPAAAEVSAPLYVVIAYSAIWLVLLLFVASVWRRQRRVEEEIAGLRQLLAGPADRGGGAR